MAITKLNMFITFLKRITGYTSTSSIYFVVVLLNRQIVRINSIIKDI